MIVDIFYVLLVSQRELDSEDVRDRVISIRKQNKLPLVGVASSNVRRQLKRLRDLYFIEKIKNRYRMNEKDKLINIFEEKIEAYYLATILARVKEYISALD